MARVLLQGPGVDGIVLEVVWCPKAAGKHDRTAGFGLWRAGEPWS